MEREAKILHGNNARIEPDTKIYSPLSALIPREEPPHQERPKTKEGWEEHFK